MIPWISLVFLVISPFSFQILLIWVFFLLILVDLPAVCQSSLFFQRNSFCFLILCMDFFISILLIWALIFIISLLLLALGLPYSCFSRYLRHSSRLSIWDLSVFLYMHSWLLAFHLGVPMHSHRLCLHFH
jgi:hypothetical protein